MLISENYSTETPDVLRDSIFFFFFLKKGTLHPITTQVVVFVLQSKELELRFHESSVICCMLRYILLLGFGLKCELSNINKHAEIGFITHRSQTVTSFGLHPSVTYCREPNAFETVYQHHNANSLLNANSSRLATKTKMISCQNMRTNNTHCLLTPLSFILFLLFLPFFALFNNTGACLWDGHSSNGRGQGRLGLLLHLLGLQVPGGAVLRKQIPQSRRRGGSCCSLLQGVKFSQVSDQLQSGSKGEIRKKSPANFHHLWKVNGFCLEELIALRQSQWYCDAVPWSCCWERIKCYCLPLLLSPWQATLST